MCRKRHFQVIAVTTVAVFNHFYNVCWSISVKSCLRIITILLNFIQNESKSLDFRFHCFFVLACFLQKFTHFFFNLMNLNKNFLNLKNAF